MLASSACCGIVSWLENHLETLMKTVVFGTGYVGLVSGVCLAEVGNTVTCVDIDSSKISALQKGQVPIYEPGLSELVLSNQEKERLSFTTDAVACLSDCDIAMIAVGTPQSENGSANLSAVFAVAQQIAEATERSLILVNKSTVPPGTGARVQSLVNEVLLGRERSDLQIEVVSNPEFLKEGNAIDDFMKPDRIVVGCSSDDAFDKMERLYQAFSRVGYKLVRMSVPSAELTKYSANAMLATRISFMNELSQLSEACGADIEDVRRGIGSDTRIGKSFLFAGLGFGGSCFPKDLNALKACYQSAGLQPKMIDAVLQINAEQRLRFLRKIVDAFQGNVQGKVFGLWGLTFKPRTDDVREAPAHTLIEELIKRGASVKCYDPKGIENTQKTLAYLGSSDQLHYKNSPYECVDGADALVLTTEWNEFRSPNFSKVKDHMRGDIVFDGRNQYREKDLQEVGLRLVAVGKGTSNPSSSATL